jgi:hypothetical protein
MGDPLVSVVVPTYNRAYVGNLVHTPTVFPPVHVAPEGSPTGFHSANLAETLITADKTLRTKAFGLIRCTHCCLAISLHSRQRLTKWPEAVGLQIRRPMGGGATTKRPLRKVFLQH